jgi:hypothetical protein
MALLRAIFLVSFASGSASAEWRLRWDLRTDLMPRLDDVLEAIFWGSRAAKTSSGGAHREGCLISAISNRVVRD